MLSVYSTRPAYGTDWSTPIKYDLQENAKQKTLYHMNVYTPEQLKGFYTHGIKTKLQVLINIIKNGEIVSQNRMNNNRISQHTGGYRSSEKDRISFSMFGDGKISEMYGKGGITFISNSIEPYRAKSNMPYEWFCNDKVPIENLTIAIDKDFASTHIAHLDPKEIFHWESRTNNYHIMVNIIKFLENESGIPLMKALYGNIFNGQTSISSNSSLDEDEDDIDNMDEISIEEFKEYYRFVLEYVIEINDDLFPNTVGNLVIALLRKYKLEGKIKVILVDYDTKNYN